jgi:hypothetical protein
MSKVINRQTFVETILAVDVANSGTFTVGYPAGTTQQSFLGGRAGSNNYVIVGDNDKYDGAKISLAYGASLITVTNSSGVTWKAGSRVRVGLDQADSNDVVILSRVLSLAAITGASGDVLTEISPNLEGEIIHWEAAVIVPATTAAKLTTLNLEIGTTNVTGGALALTSANCTPLGAVIAGAAITGNNKLTRDSKLSIEHSATTAFSEGWVQVDIHVRRDLVGDAY